MLINFFIYQQKNKKVVQKGISQSKENAGFFQFYFLHLFSSLPFPPPLQELAHDKIAQILFKERFFYLSVLIEHFKKVDLKTSNTLFKSNLTFIWLQSFNFNL